MSKRINARIDDTLMEQLDEIRQLTGQTLTELLEAALAAYCDKAPKDARTAVEAFERAGFIGIAKGPRNLSRDYRKELTRSLERKHGHR
jgi:hypothetical protein